MTKLMALTEAIDVLESVLDDVEGDNRRDVARRAWISVKETLSAYADDRDALAAKDAEIARLRGAIETYLDTDYMLGGPSHFQRTRGLRAALSGGKGE